ncbi:MAG: ribonuclease III [Pseudomonadota bacterium]
MIATNIASLEHSLEYKFNNIELMQEALRHSSFVNEQSDFSLTNNERLEFLGDSVLDLIISHLLMIRFPEMNEGDLSKMRAAIVNETQLADVAQELSLGSHLMLGKGEALAHGYEKKSILADTLEAVLAAIYLDGGIDSVSKVIESLFAERVNSLALKLIKKDFKSRLQENAQFRFKIIPLYEVISEDGPSHDKTFTVRMTVGSDISTEGIGKSKKEAEQDAAEKGLKLLKTLEKE